MERPPQLLWIFVVLGGGGEAHPSELGAELYLELEWLTRILCGGVGCVAGETGKRSCQWRVRGREPERPGRNYSERGQEKKS